MSSSSLVLKRSSLSMFQQQDYFPKVQPRSSSERDNSQLLHTALKAASTDIAHRLLDYASLDKLDCEASCILIALSNNESFHDSKLLKKREEERQVVIKRDNEQAKIKPIIIEKKAPITTTTTTPTHTTTKNDPIMLLMAAAKVVDASDNNKIEKRKRSSITRTNDYPNGRYYRKLEDSNNKRIRTSPPTPAPTHHKDHRSTRDQSDPITNNSFSRQYHSMKQNPKVKQNALHTYITYMIYNDLVHGGSTRKQQQLTTTTPLKSTHYEPMYNNNTTTPPPPLKYQKRSDYDHKPSLSSSASSSSTMTPNNNIQSDWYNNRPAIHDDRSILSRPLTAFLWNNNENNNSTSSLDKKEVMILPPLASMNNSSTRPSNNNNFDRLPPV